MQPYMGLSLYELIPGGTDAQGSPSLESEWMGVVGRGECKALGYGTIVRGVEV